MTPQQKIKWAVLLMCAEWEEKSPPTVTAENVDELYSTLGEFDESSDALNEIRCSGVETEIPCESSWHYESKSVAMRLPDSSWVGWTYWFGGGKHGEPEAIDWVGEAYHLDCAEKEEVMVVRTFSRVGD